MSKYATEKGGELQDLDDLFKSGSGSGQTWFSQDGQDLAQRYAPFSSVKLAFDTGFVARDGRDIRQWFEAKPPAADLQWAWVNTDPASSNVPNLPDHQEGDLLVVTAINPSSSSLPGNASGYTSLSTGPIGSFSSVRYSYKFATSSNEDPGTWASATKFHVVRVRNVATLGATASGTTEYPSLSARYSGRSAALFLAHCQSSAQPYKDATVLFQGVLFLPTASSYTGMQSYWTLEQTGAPTYGATQGIEILPNYETVPESEAISSAGVVSPIPPHDAGDYLIAWAVNNNDYLNFPVLPAGWTLLQQKAGTSTNQGTAVLAYRVATSSGETSGTWTNADSVSITVAKGVDALGASTILYGSTSSAIYSALTLQYPSQAGIMTFAADLNANIVLRTPGVLQPLYQTLLASSACSLGLYSSWGENSVGGAAGGWITAVLELKVTGAPPPFEGTLAIAADPAAPLSAAGFDSGKYGVFGSWTGYPADLVAFSYRNDAAQPDETRVYTYGSAQIANGATLSATVDSVTAVLQWNAAGYYSAAGDVFGLLAKAGLSVNASASALVSVQNAPIGVPAGYQAPTPPGDAPVQSIPINIKRPFAAP